MSFRPTAWILVALAALAAPRAGQVLERFERSLAPLEGTRPAQWRVVWTEDPARRATVSWTTAEAGQVHRVHYDARSRGGRLSEYAHVTPAARNGAYTIDDQEVAPPAYFHHAVLTDLPPSSRVHFVVESDGSLSPELYFVTAPEADEPFSILSGGDSRSGHLTRCVMNRLMAELVAESPEILALAHGGDYVYDGSKWTMWSDWLSHYELTVGPDGRVLPIVPARGNHDLGPLFDQVFDAPGVDGRAYYATRLSPSVALVTLNSEISAAGDQAEWLGDTLAELRPTVRWLLATYHRPIWPAVKSPSSAKPHWAPLFERHDVDLVLESDGHCMKRTVPIRDDARDPTGVVYLGEGGLGVRQRRPRDDRWYLHEPGMTRSGHHVIRIDFAADGLRSRFLLQDEPTLTAADHQRIVPPQATWLLHTGSDPAPGWTERGYDVEGWRPARASFGYGDGDGQGTLLADMEDGYERVYVRTGFDGSLVEDTRDLGLVVDYDDGFVAYLNGREVCRASVEGSGATARVESHEAEGPRYFGIEGWRELVVPGENVLALEGHNVRLGSSDFLLDPWLAGDALPDATAPEVVDDHTLRPRRR